MGTPVFAPDGTVREIPVEQIGDALRAGGKQAVMMTDPTGTARWIPSDVVPDALKNGGKIGQPSAQDEGEQFRPGFAEGVSGAAGTPSTPDELTAAQQGRSPMDYLKMAVPGLQVAGMVKDYGQNIYNRGKQAVQEAYDAGQNIGNGQPVIPNLAKAQLGVAQTGLAAIPFVGEQANKVGEDASQGNYGAALGRGLTTVALMGVGGKEAGAEKPPTPTELFQQMRPKGPQAYLSAKASGLPVPAVQAAEDIFRAAAPTGTNVKFRESLYTALPDLAEVARKVNLDEAKGGIINPDMRVRETVKAIDAHLADMYKTEREPQIEPYKNQTVQNKLDFDAKNGLRYLVKNAGQVSDRFLAAKALNGDPMTAGGLNRLAIVTNEELAPLRSMTPQERMAAQLTNKKMSGLQSLDKGLSNNLNDFLQAQGEPGLRGYEQRYAALSDVRNGLRPRINATELERNLDLGMVGKGIKAVTGGKSGIASASQAAVADVNIGRSLQGAMKSLAESGLKPNRAIRRVSAKSSQQRPSQSQ
jgi:hypothetical protein